MMYRLIILSGPLQGQRISVEPGTMTVGRAPDCQLAIPDEELALHHATLEPRRDGLYILDLGTMNRLLVNRREVREAKLKHGDTVELGRTRLLVQAVVQAEVASPPPARRRPRRWFRPALAAGLLLALGWGGWRLGGAAHRRAPPRALPHAAVPSPALPAVAPKAPFAEPLPTAEDVRRMRAELHLIREALRQLAAYTPPPVQPAAPAVPPQPPVAPTPAPAAPLPARVTIATPPAVRLLALEQQRLPDRAEYDDMRLVHITLAPTAAPLPATAELRVYVVFFDEDEYTGVCTPTEALTLQGEQAPPAAWNRRDPVTLTASCVVPRGLRDRQLLAGRKMRFAGYRVRVYAGRELQAEDARPPALLSAAWPENPGQPSGRTP